MTYIPVMIRVVDEVVPSGSIDKESPDGMGKISSCYNCGSIVFYQVESLVENTKHAVDTCTYCAVCGLMQGGYINDPFDERESLKQEERVKRKYRCPACEHEFDAEDPPFTIPLSVVSCPICGIIAEEMEGGMPQLEELGIRERVLLLRAFDYDIDSEGFVLDPQGTKMRSDEDPKKYLKIGDVMIVSGAGKSLEVLDGTPTSISKLLRKVEDAEG